MPRKRVQREPCDCFECRDTFPSEHAVGIATAQQSPPPKCLVLFLDGVSNLSGQSFAAFSADESLPHVQSVVKDGCSCLLALRSNDPDTQEGQKLTQLAQLLGPPKDSNQIGKGGKGDPLEPDTYLRNLSAALLSESEAVLELGQRSGFDVTCKPRDACPGGNTHMPLPADLAAFVINRLGLDARPSTAPEEQKPSSDFLFVDLGSLSKESDATSSPGKHGSIETEQAGQATSLEYVDALLQALSHSAAFHEGVLLVLLIRLRDLQSRLLPPAGGGPVEVDEGFRGVLRPVQSYEQAGSRAVELDRQHAILSFQRLANVVRRDEQTTLPAFGQKCRAGQGCILAERWLPQIAYKMGSAAKYGA